jgi:hypothetical protein
MLNEFIEELKHNQNINHKNNQENKVNIGYVLERLEDIKKELLENVKYFDYHNKNMTKSQNEKIDNIKESLTNKGVFK